MHANYGNPAGGTPCKSQLPDHDCTVSCNSQSHKNSLVRCVSRAKNCSDLLRWFTCICSTRRPFRVRDSYGQSGLHLAASLGKNDIISLFLRQRGVVEGSRTDGNKAGINELDNESGWSPLHRAVFHGEIESAALLAANGVDLNLRDHDGYTAAQLLLFDMGDVMQVINRSYEEPKDCFPVAFYSWGSNMNFTLGFGDDHERNVPDRIRAPFPSGRCMVACQSVQSGIACTNCGNSSLEALRSIARGEMHLQIPAQEEHQLLKNPKSTLHTIVPRELAEYRIREAIPLPVIDIVLRKFHTLFLTPDGTVFACGHGRGGRLGLAMETTYLHPTRISVPNHPRTKFIAIAAGLNHSVFLTSQGAVYACGSNEYFQLGISGTPATVLIPTEISTLPNLIHGQFRRQGGSIVEVKYIGVAAERCHTMVWTKDSLYACGYNGGQLGSRPDRSGKSQKIATVGASLVKPELPAELVSVLFREITEIKSLMPARFVRCSDAAVLVCGAQFDIILLHEYEVKRLAKLPRLFGVRPDQFCRLTELCVFGGNLELPGKEASLRRSLVIVALVSDVPLLYLDSGKGSWLPVALEGLPRDMEAIYHISVSADTLMLCTQYGECYKVKLSHPERKKSSGKSELITYWHAERVPRLHRALKVFSEPGGRNFAVIQTLPPYHFQPCITQWFDDFWVGESRNFRQENSVKPDVHIIFNEFIFEMERLTLITGSRWFRKHLLNVSPQPNPDRTTPTVLDVSGITSLDQLRIDLDNAYYMKEWPQIQENCYARGKNLWDIEPDMQIFCDEDGALLNCHRWLLVSRVLYFSCLLEGNRWKDSMKERAPVLPCNQKIGLSFLEFIYTGRISSPLWNWDDCMNLLRLADFLVEDKMRTEAVKYFKPSFNSDQVANLYRISNMHNSAALKEQCMKQMSWMLPDLLESRQLETLDVTSLKMLTSIYKERYEVFDERIIPPYTFPEIDSAVVDLTEPMEYPVDTEPDSLTEPHSSKTKSKKHTKRYNQEGNISDSLDKTVGNIVDVSRASKTENPIQSCSSHQKLHAESDAWHVVSSVDLKSKIRRLKDPKIAGSGGVDSFVPQSSTKPFGLDDSSMLTLHDTPPEISKPSTSKLVPEVDCMDDEEEYFPPAASSSPLAVKAHKNVQSGSSGPRSSLSSIFEEQRRESVMQAKKTQSVIVHGAKNPHRKRFVGQKLSFEEAQAVVTPPVKPSSAEGAPPKRTGNPWNKPQSSGTLLSDIMMKEENAIAVEAQPSTSKPSTPARRSVNSVQEKHMKLTAKFVPVVKASPQWGSPSAVPEPVSSPVDSFQQILRDEQEQQAQLQRSRSRPMHIIQIEERAVEELLEFYGARENPEECIEVFCVAPKEAPASWSARAFR